MAEFNSCASLVSDDSLKAASTALSRIKNEGKNPLQAMLDMQLDLQTNLATSKPDCNKHPHDLKTCGDILTWMRNQDDYLADETRELYTALGGMSNGEKTASSIWKPWKAKHLEFFNKEFNELSSDDKLEIYFEMIDQVHFFMNKLLALKLSADDVFMLYYLKNKENFDRQERGY